mgnify:CR=1 FL=1
MKSQKDTYKSIIVSYENDSFSCNYEKQKFRDLKKNEVLVKISYSTINYKDALSVVGLSKIIRTNRLVPGLDLSGVVIESNSNKFKVNDKVKNKLILSLARNSGASGMVLGQALDIAAETSQKELEINEISKIQEYKTGKLISWSCEVGPIIAEENTEPFSLYAAKIGLAFQIIDDILDVTSSSKTLGKNVGKDMDKNKATFVSKLGLDNSKKKALELVSEACEAISGFKDRSRNLCQIANFIVSRQF